MESEPTNPKLIRSRRAAREVALRALYQIDIAKIPARAAVVTAIGEEKFAPEARLFIDNLIDGYLIGSARIDAEIQACLSSGWELARLGSTDRNLLRIACVELFDLPTIPPKATIDEAVTLAKKYGEAESGKFVNGVLATMLLRSPKRDWSPPEEEVEGDPDPEPEPQTDLVTDDEPEVVEEGSEGFEALVKAGPWTIRKGED